MWFKFRLLIIATMALGLFGVAVAASPEGSGETQAGNTSAQSAEEEDSFALEPVDPDRPEKIRKWNAECYACHSEAGLKSPPRADMDLKKLADMLITANGFDNSVHTGMACKECHANGYVEYPHGQSEKSLIKPCLECHPQRGKEIVAEFKKSIHTKDHADKFTCVSCHEAHYMQVTEKIVSPRRIVEQDNSFCIDCHESEYLYSQIVPTKKLPNLNKVHSWLPNSELHWTAVRCVDCHTPQASAGISHEIQPKDRAERQCASCHSADSSLRTRLYRHLAREDRLSKVGFVNGFILTDAYVVGATRNEWLDKAGMWAVSITIVGLLLHGLVRILATLIRRRNRNV